VPATAERRPPPLARLGAGVGGEGIVLKDRRSAYKPGTRSRCWWKAKHKLTLTVEVLACAPELVAWGSGTDKPGVYPETRRAAGHVLDRCPVAPAGWRAGFRCRSPILRPVDPAPPPAVASGLLGAGNGPSIPPCRSYLRTDAETTENRPETTENRPSGSEEKHCHADHATRLACDRWAPVARIAEATR
jgi:hypothetical protein